MKLHQAFEITRGDVVSFVGAGGKTSALVALGYELAAAGWRVLATTTTRIGLDQLELFPYSTTLDAGAGHLSLALGEQRFIFLHGAIRQNKVHGPDGDFVPRLLDTLDSDVLLIEADGARGLPLKAPKAHEPVIASDTTLLVPVASLTALGQPLDEDHIYNAGAIDDYFGFGLGNRIKSPWIAQILRDEAMGLLRGVPERARVIGLLNQTPETGYLRARGRMIAQLALQSKRLKAVALGSVRAANPILEVQRQVGAVVLAAGLSKRMGQAKVLLAWDGEKTIIEHILGQLIAAKVRHIVVVTGRMAHEVGAIAKRMGVETVHNPAYETGEIGSSLQVGLQAMPPQVSAAMAVLGDQPRLQPQVIGQVLAAYAEGQGGGIVAPRYQGQRGHPLLLDRRYWQDIYDLPSGAPPRKAIERYEAQIAYVDVDTDSILGDVDTPEQYRQERRKAGLDS